MNAEERARGVMEACTMEDDNVVAIRLALHANALAVLAVRDEIRRPRRRVVEYAEDGDVARCDDGTEWVWDYTDNAWTPQTVSNNRTIPQP